MNVRTKVELHGFTLNFGETKGEVGKKWRTGAQKRQYLWNA